MTVWKEKTCARNATTRATQGAARGLMTGRADSVSEWISVKERLPEKDGWYLVYAPRYWGNSKIYGLDGLAYANFKHNYKDHWGIERGTGRGWPGIVTHWMHLPEPPKENQQHE